MNILEAIDRNLSIADPAWHFPESAVETSLSEIKNQSLEYAARLSSLSVGMGDRVGILLDNCSEYAPILLGIWRLNALAVPLRPKSGKYFDLAEYLEATQRICRFRTLIVADDSDPTAVEECARRFNIPILFLKDVLASPSRGEIPQDPGILPEDTAVIQFSSGTTGSPKGVVVTHAMMIAQLEQINREVAAGCQGSRVISSASWLPFNHDMGLFIGLLNPLFTGAENLLASARFYLSKPRRWFTLMNQYRTTLHFTTNSALSASFTSLGTLEEGSLDLSHLYLYIGAEKVMPAVLQSAYRVLHSFKMDKQNIRIGYGMAENTLGAASTNRENISVRKFSIDAQGILSPAEGNDPSFLETVSIGSPHRGTTITIRDEGGNELPDLALGEINIEGPCVMRGYFRNEEASRQCLSSGRLKTGDLGFTFEGEYYFHSRKDDLLIVGGKNIVPDEIESQVETLGFIRPTCTALVGVHEPISGELQLRLLVEAKLPVGTRFGIEHRKLIQQKVFESTGLLIPFIHACVSGSVEKTSSGKKRRKVISQRFARGEIQMAD